VCDAWGRIGKVLLSGGVVMIGAGVIGFDTNTFLTLCWAESYNVRLFFDHCE